MNRIGMIVRTILAAIFGLGGVVYAGSACLAGISECTSVMRRHTSTSANVNEICRSMVTYFLCIERFCPNSLSPCYIETAGSKLFDHLRRYGYVCRDVPELSALVTNQYIQDGTNCSFSQSLTESLSSASSSSSSLSSSFSLSPPSLPSLLFAPLLVTRPYAIFAVSAMIVLVNILL